MELIGDWKNTFSILYSRAFISVFTSSSGHIPMFYCPGHSDNKYVVTVVSIVKRHFNRSYNVLMFPYIYEIQLIEQIAVVPYYPVFGKYSITVSPMYPPLFDFRVLGDTYILSA